jgi:predicted  nucleic acid-binding Zn-ribbon protein
MNQKINSMYILVLGVAALILGCPSVSVANPKTVNPASDYLVEMGKRHIKKGDIEAAYYEFRRALLVNPQNELAKKHLRDLGFPEDVPNGIQTQTSYMLSLMDKVKAHDQEIASIQADKEGMSRQFNDQLGALETQKNSLAELNATQEQEIASANEQVAGAREQIDVLNQKINDLEGQTKVIPQDDQDKDWTSHVRHMEEFYGKLDDVKLHDTKPLKQKVDRLEEKLTKSLDKNIEYEQTLASINQQSQEVQQEAARRTVIESAMIDVLEEFVTIKQRQIEDLRDEIVYHQMDTMAVEEHQQQIAILEDELRRAQEDIQELLSHQ